MVAISPVIDSTLDSDSLFSRPGTGLKLESVAFIGLAKTLH
jgi:hypothetical protein